jgi:hypothetical protein
MADETTIEVTDGNSQSGGLIAAPDNRLTTRELGELQAKAVRAGYGFLNQLSTRAADANGEILVSFTKAYTDLFNSLGMVSNVAAGDETYRGLLFAPDVPGGAVEGVVPASVPPTPSAAGETPSEKDGENDAPGHGRTISRGRAKS